MMEDFNAFEAVLLFISNQDIRYSTKPRNDPCLCFDNTRKMKESTVEFLHHKFTTLVSKLTKNMILHYPSLTNFDTDCIDLLK